MIDRATVDRILDAAHIEDVVSDFVSLKKRGVNYVGLCPFHDDKTPSFYVSPTKGLCKCFACGKGGNVVHFIMEHEQLSYPEALKWLARKYHIEVSERELTPEERESQTIRDSLFLVNEFACQYFQDILHNHIDGKNIGMQYFRARGIREDIIAKFKLGYSTNAPDALAKAATQNGYKKDYLLKSGLCYERETDHTLHDRFWGRVIFPWFNVSGKVVAFGGRVLDSRTKGVSQKYVNSPESEIYTKGRELFGIWQAKQAIAKKDCVYMVEGYTDVIAMHQCGLENVVANSGTALTPQQIRLLHRFTDNITLLYDGDEAGIHASIRGIDMLLAEGMNIKVLLLPDGDDPDSFSRKHSVVGFQDYIRDHEENFIRFKANLLLKNAQNDPIRRAELITDMAGSISLIPDEVKRYTFLKECAQLLAIDEQVLQNAINASRRKRKENKPSDNQAQVPFTDSPPEGEKAGDSQIQAGGEAKCPPPQVEGMEKPAPIAALERDLISCLIRHGEKACIQTEENGSTLSVADVVKMSFDMDGVRFQNSLYGSILEELLSHQHDADFVATRYFQAHPDTSVSMLAAEVCNDRYKLRGSVERLMATMGKNDESRLSELIPQLLIEYKLAILKQQQQQLRIQLSQAEASNDPVLSSEVMRQCMEISDKIREVARHAGERVVLRF